MRPDESLKSYNADFCGRVLNRMIKHMQTDARQLWVYRIGYLFFEKDKHKYTFGTDHVATAVNSTAMRVAGSDTDTTLEVDSTTGMTAADVIGIEMDDGTMHWDTIASVTDSDTVVITNGIDDSAAIDNVIYWYTTKITDPLRVVHCVYHYYDGTDAKMEEIARTDYWDLANKTQDTRPSQWYYDPQLTASDLYLYGEPDDVKDYIIVHYQQQFDDMDAAADNFAFPNEALKTITIGLAAELCSPYRVPQDKAREIKREAAMAKDEWSSWDRETATLKLQPKVNNGR